ncbi:membrane protein [Gordonia phage Secretariat]|uniref:Membrane protein n=1 Tax=Gordonia phage Secretariat TaxID=2725616 RepID=A0A6M3SVN8_9CAUD|nr:membrane protein [Gordonia phage Secretariat]QJD49619.1 membrane protein [Gordonia phage Secretariat]
MIKGDHGLLSTALVALVIFEGFALVKMSNGSRYKELKIEVLQDVARYYADILEKNEVQLTDYDVIALNAILERGPAIKSGRGN